MNAFSHLTFQELENRKKFLKQEYHRVCSELDRRKNTNSLDGDLWEPIEDLKKKMVREYQFPEKINEHLEIEEKKLTKEGVNNIKNMISQIKSGIKNEIAKDVGIINNDIQKLLQIGDKIASNEKNNNTQKIYIQQEDDDENEEEEEDETNTKSNNNDDIEEIDLEENNNKNKSIKENDNNKKKRVLGKNKKTYADLNPVIRDLWTK